MSEQELTPELASSTDLSADDVLARLCESFRVDDAVTAAVREAVAGMDAETVASVANVLSDPDLARCSSDALDALKRAAAYIADCTSTRNYTAAWRKATAEAA